MVHLTESKIIIESLKVSGCSSLHAGARRQSETKRHRGHYMPGIENKNVIISSSWVYVTIWCAAHHKVHFILRGFPD